VRQDRAHLCSKIGSLGTLSSSIQNFVVTFLIANMRLPSGRGTGRGQEAEERERE
jgi:hypothetical protein